MQFRWYEYFVVLAPEVCTVAHDTDEHVHFDAQVRVAGKKKGLTRLYRGALDLQNLVTTERQINLQSRTIDL